MKKQVVEGWAYPCEKIIKKEKINAWSWFEMSIYAFRRMMDYDCKCGKNCKPIKVKVTIEPVGGRDEKASG